MVYSTRYWYLASPYTAYPGSFSEARDAVARDAALLMEAGVKVFCPIAHTDPIVAAGDLRDKPLEWWLEQDFPFMWFAHGMILCQLPGWDTSLGVARERNWFECQGKPVVLMEPGQVPQELRACLSC